MNKKQQAAMLPDTNNRLVALAADIQAKHTAILRTTVEVAEQVIAAGNMLAEAKASIAHGQWDRWVKERAGLNPRTARRYMQIARSGLETATVADLGVRGASEQIARAVARPGREANTDPAYLTWRDEMLEGLRNAPSQAARDQFMQVVRGHVSAEQLAAWLKARANGLLDQIDFRDIIQVLEARLAQKVGT